VPDFVDVAQLHAKGGDGGAGCISFRREAYVSRGGPDGGDGGDGGSVILKASKSVSSLYSFKYHPFRRAENGTHGSSKKKHGKSGKDLIVEVPIGTVIKKDGDQIAELTVEDAQFIAAHGGRGGKGNARFLTNHLRAPQFAEQGEMGDDIWWDLELKLLADVALVGLPNAGKSTIISVISNAKPKIADYPFTTLVPNLGVVKLGLDEMIEDFVVADIPGLIEGAAEGKGLGHDFLRHIQRSPVLVFVLDLSDNAVSAPDSQLETIMAELKRFDVNLLERPKLVVGNKLDAATTNAIIVNRDLDISAKTGTNIDFFITLLAKKVSEIRFSETHKNKEPEIFDYEANPNEFYVQKDGSRFVVRGKGANRAVKLSTLEDPLAVAEIQNRIKKLGIEKALVDLGVSAGDIVCIGDFEFTFVPD
jgi:GTP-binding protein